MHGLMRQKERGEITATELVAQIDVIHDLKIECDARFLTDAEAVERGLLEASEVVAEPEPEYEQTSIFQAPLSVRREAGRLARDQAVERVDEHADPDWKVKVLKVIYELVLRRLDLISDDVWDALGGEPSPRERRAMGPMMQVAAKKGWIEPTEQMRQAHRGVNHARPQRVWRSLIYRESP